MCRGQKGKRQNKQEEFPTRGIHHSQSHSQLPATKNPIIYQCALILPVKKVEKKKPQKVPRKERKSKSKPYPKTSHCCSIILVQ